MGGLRPEDPVETTLRDGTRVLVRQLEPADKQGLANGLARLSTRARYLRFHSGVEQLTDQQLRYLTEVDQQDHVAWGAIDLDAPERPGIGVARFVRVADRPDVAEAAVTVVDQYQGRGLGTILLGILGFAAARRGIRAFRAYVLGENAAMLELLTTLGARFTEQEPGVYCVEVDLPETPDDLSLAAAGKVLAAVTGKQLPPLRTSVPPVWIGDEPAAAPERQLLREWLNRILERWS